MTIVRRRGCRRRCRLCRRRRRRSLAYTAAAVHNRSVAAAVAALHKQQMIVISRDGVRVVMKRILRNGKGEGKRDFFARQQLFLRPALTKTRQALSPIRYRAAF